MNEQLKNRYVIITGASGGIGEKMAVLVAKNGGHPILIARRTDRLAAVAETITRQYDVNCTYHQLDVSDLHAVQQTLNRFLRTFRKLMFLLIMPDSVFSTQLRTQHSKK